jgi:hypothetical protein
MELVYTGTATARATASPGLDHDQLVTASGLYFKLQVLGALAT